MRAEAGVGPSVVVFTTISFLLRTPLKGQSDESGRVVTMWNVLVYSVAEREEGGEGINQPQKCGMNKI